MEAGQRNEYLLKKPEDAKLNMLYAGWSSSTGELDYAVRPVLATSSFPPRGSNESYYSNPAVDQALFYALGTTDRAEKTKLYTEVQEEIWKDAPWAFLVTESCSTRPARS